MLQSSFLFSLERVGGDTIKIYPGHRSFYLVNMKLSRKRQGSNFIWKRLIKKQNRKILCQPFKFKWTITKKFQILVALQNTNIFLSSGSFRLKWSGSPAEQLTSVWWFRNPSIFYPMTLAYWSSSLQLWGWRRETDGGREGARREREGEWRERCREKERKSVNE